MTIRWRQISPWCWQATIVGIVCRVWLAADESGWHAWHSREVRDRSLSRSPVRIVFPLRRDAMRVARVEAEKVIAWDRTGRRARKR